MPMQDNYDVKGTPTTAGAVAFMDNFPFQDSTMVCCFSLSTHCHAVVLKAYCGQTCVC